MVSTKSSASATKRWLILSHGFNMDGRASSQTITDKIPYLLEDGVQPVVFSAITGIKDQRFVHRQFLAWGPAAFRFDFRHWIANQYGRGFIYKLLTRTVSILLAPLIGLEKLIDNWFQIKYFTDCRESVEEMVIQINMTSFRCGISDNDCGGCSAMTAKTIKYVHTFQNIYKLFVGKDLDTSKILNK